MPYLPEHAIIEGARVLARRRRCFFSFLTSFHAGHSLCLLSNFLARGQLGRGFPLSGPAFMVGDSLFSGGSEL